MNKKPNRYSSAGTNADSEQKDEDLFVSQHSSKPHVMRSPFCVEPNDVSIYYELLN